MNPHPLDAALAAAAPLLANRFGGLPDVEIGRKELVGASDGIYVRAATPALRVCAPIAPATLPYAPMSMGITPANGPVPLDLLRTFAEWAAADREREIAAVIETHQGAYRLRRLEARDRSASHVTYDDAQVDDDTLVIDLHSHGRLGSYFSETDDASDLSRRGPYIAAVVGECGERDIFSFRLVSPPYLLPLDIDWLVQTGVLA